MAGKHQVYSDAENDVLRAELRKLRTERRLTQKQVGDLLGIEQQNAGRLLSVKGQSGMGRPSANALARERGFRDAEDLLIDRGVLAALQDVPSGGAWTDRDRALSIARKMGYDEEVVEAVRRRFTDDEYQAKSMRWWNDKVVLEQLEHTANRSDRMPEPPKSTPRTADSGTELTQKAKVKPKKRRKAAG